MESDRIEVAPIQAAVRSTVAALRAARDAPNLDSRRSFLIRSLYFPVFLSGAFTVDSDARAEIGDMLIKQPSRGEAEDVIGNGGKIFEVLHRLWEHHDEAYHGHGSIPWKDVLRDSQILLI